MPIYRFRCDMCGHEETHSKLMSESDWRPVCSCFEGTTVMRKVLSANIQFAYGRDVFHGATIKERQEQQIAEARSVGIEPVPIGYRDYSGPSK